MAEENLTKTTDLKNAQVREINFTLKFVDDLRKLIEALGITRKIAKEAGHVLKTYKATGTLGEENVAEGETIPLSKYVIEATPYKEIELQKRRKATTAEAIIKYGFNQAVNMTNKEMLKDCAKLIRKNFFTEMLTGTGVATGTNIQSVLANAWGQLQVLFEDTDSKPVFFVNPLDVADYIGKANITTQTAFGFKYVENFLGIGTLMMHSDIPQGKIVATPEENLVMYYITVNGADLGEVFEFTSDETGYIGIHETPDYDNMTASETVIWGIEFFAEKLDGVVIGTISSETTDDSTDDDDDETP